MPPAQVASIQPRNKGWLRDKRIAEMASMVKHGIKYLEKIHLELGHVMIYGAAHGEYKPRQLKS